MTRFDRKKFKKKCLYAVQYEFCLCYLCGQPITKNQKWNLDHVVSVSQGGATSENNLRPVHERCNNEKGALTYQQYKEWKSLNDIRLGITKGKTK